MEPNFAQAHKGDSKVLSFNFNLLIGLLLKQMAFISILSSREIES